MNKIDITAPFEERAEALLCRVFGGMHHVHKLNKEPEVPRWTCLHHGELSTFDFNKLTCLVLAAHDYCLRVSIESRGFRWLRIVIHKRAKRESEHYWDKHPTIEAAIEKWRAGR